MTVRTRRVLNLKIFFHMPVRILATLFSSSNTHGYLRLIRLQAYFAATACIGGFFHVPLMTVSPGM
jgi:hypothetical protein